MMDILDVCLETKRMPSMEVSLLLDHFDPTNKQQ